MTSLRVWANVHVGAEEQLSSPRWSLASLPAKQIRTHSDSCVHVMEFFAPTFSAPRPTRTRLRPGLDVELTFKVGDFTAASDEFELITIDTSSDRSLLILSGGPLDTAGLQLLSSFTYESAGLNWRSLASSDAREAWLRACLMLQSATTPPLSKTPRTVVLDAALFEDRSSLFCLIGEGLRGHRGYGGQDLDGLEEVLRLFMSRSIPVEFILRRPAELRSRMSGYLGERDFFMVLQEVLSSGGASVVQA